MFLGLEYEKGLGETGCSIMSKVCAFFGHRDLDGDIAGALESAVYKTIQTGTTTFWCGGYGAFDSLAAHTVQKLKKEYPQIQLIRILAYLPVTHEDWTDYYDGTIYPEGLEVVPRRFAIRKRNDWMAQNCDIAITYVNHDFGGAYQAWKKAMRQGKEIYNLGTYEDVK